MLARNLEQNNLQSGQERFNFILSKLDKVTVDNNTAKACCPAHSDASPSLEVKLHSNEKISVKCFIGCDYKDILSAIDPDLTPVFLYPPEKQKTARSASRTVPAKNKIAKIYQYKKGNGQPAYEAVRFEDKKFRFRKDASQARWSLKGITRVPYNLPKMKWAIRKTQPIFFVEGEKDADNGNELGLTCTTVAGGCGKWRDEYEKYFEGADIIFIPDNDEAGIKGVLRIAKKLKDGAGRIRILHLPVENKGDLSDWIEAGGDKKQLWSLIALEGLFLDEALMVDQLNNKHAVIMVQGKFVVINEDYNPSLRRKEITMSSKDHFRDRYEHKPAKVTKFKKSKTKDEKGKDIYEPKPFIKDKGFIWIRSPQRRQYDGFCFNPDDKNKVIDGFYNLWRGFAVKPREGDCTLYKQHIFEVIAQGNKEIYTYIMNWMADAVQNITKRPTVTVVLRGGSGAGKGAMITLFGKLFGQHFLPVTNSKHIVGNFNAHLKDCLILFADEAFYAGDKQHESTLKGLITEDTRMVEYKGKDVVILPNYTRTMMASNKSWVAPLEMDDRRFFILDVASKKIKDHKYFDALFHQMTNEKGSEALLYELLHRDISKVNIQNYPATQATLDNKLESLDSVGQWIFYILSSGDMDKLQIDENIYGLYEIYRKSCDKQRPASMNAWSRQIRKFFPGVERVQRTGQSHRYYEFPDLDICRQQFEDRLHAKIEWDPYEKPITYEYERPIIYE